MIRQRIILSAAALLALSSGPALAEPTFPALTGPVVDSAHEFDDATMTRLSDEIRAWKAKTGRQMQVVTVPDLQDEAPEDYVRELGDHWSIGRKDINDGIILLQSVKERRVQAATGGGVQGELTDADASDIINDVAVPLLKKGDVQGGLAAAAEAMMAKATPVVVDPRVAAKEKADSLARWASFKDFVLDLIATIAAAAAAFGGWLLATRKRRAAVREAKAQAEREATQRAAEERAARAAESARAAAESARIQREAAEEAQRKRQAMLDAMTPAARATFLADEAAAAERARAEQAQRDAEAREEARRRDERRRADEEEQRQRDAANAAILSSSSSASSSGSDYGSSSSTDTWSGGGGSFDGGGAGSTY